MSILIKGMSKPKTCDDCIVPLSKCDYLQKRADNCPLIEIPTPHGRLIDGDELVKHLRKDPLFDLVERYGISGVIESRPTILEEEELEDDVRYYKNRLSEMIEDSQAEKSLIKSAVKEAIKEMINGENK